MTPDLPELSPVLIRAMVKHALAEDMPTGQDLTSWIMPDRDKQVIAHIVARQDGVLAGMEFAMATFTALNSEVRYKALAMDGEKLAPGQKVLQISGKAASLFSAERVALNFLGLMSGTATLTNKFVQAVDGTNARIVCTRKTIPGLRAAQKHAVLAGGGANHRHSLSDAVLIKDNHIAAAGGIAPALARARELLGHMVKVEVETDTLAQVREALDAGADVILLDNMNSSELEQAVKFVDGKIPLEASGGVNLDTVAGIASTGVDYISIGALTHSAPSFDFGMDV